MIFRTSEDCRVNDVLTHNIILLLYSTPRSIYNKRGSSKWWYSTLNPYNIKIVYMYAFHNSVIPTAARARCRNRETFVRTSHRIHILKTRDLTSRSIMYKIYILHQTSRVKVSGSMSKNTVVSRTQWFKITHYRFCTSKLNNNMSFMTWKSGRELLDLSYYANRFGSIS